MVLIVKEFYANVAEVNDKVVIIQEKYVPFNSVSINVYCNLTPLKRMNSYATHRKNLIGTR